MRRLEIEATFDKTIFRVHAVPGWEVLVNNLPSLEAAQAWCAEHHPEVEVLIAPHILRG